MRAAAVEPQYPGLCISTQCQLLGINRAAYYYEQKDEAKPEELKLLTAILACLKEHPFYGYRKIALQIKHLGVSRKQVRRLMKRAGLRAIYPGKRLSKPGKGHKTYPYLLRGKKIWLPNQVWAADITYLKLPGGHVYLVVILDLYTRKILSWRVSNMMDTTFCVAALEDALACYGSPAIFNTDQGSQFTAEAFISVLAENNIQISMDGVKRAFDNIFVERFWRSLKYEDIYLKSYQTLEELKSGVLKYVSFYNTERFHQALEYNTPDELYENCFIEPAISLVA